MTAKWARSCFGGTGERAFCTGGDQSAHDGNYDGRGTIGLPMEELHTAIRDAPKPVIARVQGYAIGGGNVLCHHLRHDHLLREGHLRPGRPEDGLGRSRLWHAFLARVVGEKKAREIWYMCRATAAPRPWPWGWPMPACRTTSSTPNARNGVRNCANAADCPGHRQAQLQHGHRASGGIAGMGMYALKLYYDTEESREGVECPEGKAQARVPQVRQIGRPRPCAAPRTSSPSRAGGMSLCRPFDPGPPHESLPQ